MAKVSKKKAKKKATKKVVKQEAPEKSIDEQRMELFVAMHGPIPAQCAGKRVLSTNDSLDPATLYLEA